MTQNDFESLQKEVAMLEDPADESGVTCDAMCKIDDNPEKSLDYLLYLKTRSYYANPDPNKIFSNEDALPCDQVHDWIDEILQKVNIESIKTKRK